MKNYFSLLDPLRFGAALGVAIFHLMFWSWAGTENIAPLGFEHLVAAPMEFKSAAPYTWFWWVGVEIFFVISGFVIANSASKSTPGEFLIGRALRLYPAVWVCTTLSFIVLLVFAGDKASGFILPYIRAMLLVPKGINGQWLDAVYWTLAAEMAFYALVFCSMLTRTVTLRHIAIGLTLWSAAFNLFSVLVLTHVIDNNLLYWVVLMFRVPGATWLLNHGCFFALGIWLFMSANRKLTTFEWCAVAVTCLSGAAEIYYFASFMLAAVPAISEQSAFEPVLAWGAVVLLIALAANKNRRAAETPSLDAWREAPAYFRTLGLITYPFYLIHNITGSAVIRVLSDAGLDDTMAVWTGLALLAVFCWFTCAKIEPAIRGLLKTAIANARRLPKTVPTASLPKSARPISWGTPAANFPGPRKLRGAAA